ncbi:hypothetical protein SISSUDRAFT_1062531 [Sistotremastrum suecicum HHB10207 ss-3]|uniref:CBM1 domain-containing protein n=1 Tax=Sistotremastrum suecicum HHB10207 ss-3 TaxID=1314776 RepID=A0A166CSX1_9AGAM|nr:hypothetical protein SISSUDRAFT_1062531 [Sistotremastrum suecicum HHB10207 ss-3]
MISFVPIVLLGLVSLVQGAITSTPTITHAASPSSTLCTSVHTTVTTLGGTCPFGPCTTTTIHPTCITVPLDSSSRASASSASSTPCTTANTVHISTICPTTTISCTPTEIFSTITSTSIYACPTMYQSVYGQCGGQGYVGPSVCTTSATCNPVYPTWYSQCLPKTA